MLRRILLTTLALLVAGLIAAGWYAYNKGFTHKWRGFVVQEFHKRGVELSLTRLTLEPFRGIVAKQVRIYDKRDRRRVVAVVDEVRLVINFANLFRGKTFIDALDLHDANLAVPLDPSGKSGAKVEIRHLGGLLFLPPQQIYLSRLEADLYGIHLRASGRLINPQGVPFFQGKNDADFAQLGERIIAELKALNFDGTTPQIDARFTGDLAKPEQLFIEATVWAEKVRRDQYGLDNFYVSGSFRDGIVRLRQMTANDAGGAFRAGGSYDVATCEATLQLHSGLDVQALVRSFARIVELEECVFYAPPEIDLTARATFNTPLAFQFIGHTGLKKFAYKSVIFDSFDADLSWDGERWAAIDVRLAHRTGEVTGDMLHLESDNRSSLKSTIQRKVLAPLFAGKAADWLPRIEFIESANAEPIAQRVVADSTSAREGGH